MAEAKRSNISFAKTSVPTEESCPVSWAYLHTAFFPSNRVSTSWTTPIVLPSSLDHSSLLRNVTPPLVDAAATVMARSTSVNRLSTFCRHRRLYMLLHRHRMPSCFVGPAIRLQGALALRLRLRRCAIQICQSLRRFVLIGFLLKSTLA